MNLNSSSLACAVFAVLLGTPSSAELRADREKRANVIPATIKYIWQGHTQPAWVAADAAFDANGELQASLFSESDRSVIEDNRRLNAEAAECQAFTGSPHESYRVSETFDDAVANSLTITSGEVEAVQQGFYTGLPGTLIAVRISERLKTFGRAGASADRIYVFVQEAKIPTAKGLICASTFGAVPTVSSGDRVVVFADLDPIDRDGLIVSVNPQAGLVLARNDTLILPRAFREASIETFDDVLSKVRIHPRLHAVGKKNR